ncbi:MULTISPECIES: ABC transporter substrate-binding protein [unclassified Roseofilum]|uniref:ABC transporter substrate-binding protein n=1 Tax=unclassified Roseofilum TaxID=2620099 RepID=UPI000E8C9B50|nr:MULTISPECIES: ABC transporter substrate-binding protein [unclassified Roseofilum]MBP0008085.1 ABC transporter substrate-binding protein [Roseofilum sp. Belize Diploria]MBP0034508.1 ABC transporter substrate-binding protein [Roseofilum sp. Belize BBD 4]HBQ97103.1 nitrate ABC transporter substrate-binding protein [Cyanobacteria bacterium UBA11691]
MTQIPPISRRQFLHLSSFGLGGGLLSVNSPRTQKINSLDSIKFALSWKAEAEYGGFYQALATGIYQKHGLDVTIRPVNPQTNSTQLLLGGALEFNMGSSLNIFKAIEQNIPLVTVASMFQKNIQVLLTHPGVGNESLADLKGKPIFISSGARFTYWPVLKQNYEFRDNQIRPYNSNVTPFLVDEQSAQQGVLTSEPYTIEQKGGFKPIVHLLADAGYNPYSFTITTTRNLVNDNPDLVHRFVDASIRGWYSYLDNPKPGNRLIKRDNPEMTDDLLDYSFRKLKEYDILISGEAKMLGVGAMTDERWKAFFQSTVDLDMVDSGVDYHQAYTLKFVNKGVDYYLKLL